MSRQTYKFASALLLILSCGVCAAQANNVQQPAAAPTPPIAQPTNPAGETPRFQIPQNIAEAADAARREAVKKAQEEATPPKSTLPPGASSTGQGYGASGGASGVQQPPRIVVPFQEMRLVSIFEVDGKRLAGLHINSNTNFVVEGASIGNGWQVQSIDRTSVVVVQMNAAQAVNKKTKANGVPVVRTQTLMLDASPRLAGNAGPVSGGMPASMMPTPLPFR